MQKLIPVAIACALTLACTSPRTAAQGWDWQPDKNGVWEMGFGPQPPHLVHAATAEIPADTAPSMARTCLVVAVVGADGVPSDAQEVGGCAGPLKQASVDAVKRSEFKPGTFHGTPVPVRVRLWLRFQQGASNAEPKILSSTVRRADLGTGMARPLTPVEAQYTAEARRAKLQGVVTVSAIVTEEGVPVDVHVIRGLGKGLDEKSIETVAHTRFQPAMRDGNPVPVPFTVELNYRLY
jgi:TonB family protein